MDKRKQMSSLKESCPDCGATGKIYIETGSFEGFVDCGSCRGSGEVLALDDEDDDDYYVE